MLLIPNWTILPMWLIFMAALLVLNHFVFKPTLKILALRLQKTFGFEKEAKNFQEQAEIKLKEYEALMAEARNQARINRDEILKSASSKEKELVATARLAAEKEIGLVKNQIIAESKLARVTLTKESDVLAQQIADQLVHRKVA